MPTFASHWASIVLPDGMKERMVRTVVAGIRLRSAVPFPDLPLHGVMLLTGPPGTGKTTLARGLADKVARTMQGPRPWRFAEVDPHELASSQLGRSQRGVSQLFGTVLHEQAAAGPLIVLFDEVETVFTDRRGLSLDANPIDVHRAVDAALVGLDQLAQRHPDILHHRDQQLRRRDRPGAGIPSRPDLRDARSPASRRAGRSWRRPSRRSPRSSPARPGSSNRPFWTRPPRRLTGWTAAGCARPWPPRAPSPRTAAGDPDQVSPGDLLAALTQMPEASSERGGPYGRGHPGPHLGPDMGGDHRAAGPGGIGRAGSGWTRSPTSRPS